MARSNGMLLGLIAVVGFSLSLPMTRLAVPYFGPEFVSFGRTALAGLLALLALGLRREQFPRRHLWPLFASSLCTMLAYPLLTALALRHVPAMHGAVIVGFMPALTAVCAVVRAGERPSVPFWIACVFGAAAVSAFAVVTGAGHFGAADLLLVAAALLCSYGYTEGALVARAIGGWRVVFWGQAMLLPITVPVFGYVLLHMPQPLTTAPAAWIAFADLVIVSALLGFLVWYMGLAIGGVARVGQLQLLQLPLSCAWSVAFLGEHLDMPTVLAAIAIVCSAGITVAMRSPRIATAAKANVSTPILALSA